MPQNSHYKEKGKETKERLSLVLQHLQKGKQERQCGGVSVAAEDPTSLRNTAAPQLVATLVFLKHFFI